MRREIHSFMVEFAILIRVRFSPLLPFHAAFAFLAVMVCCG